MKCLVTGSEGFIGKNLVACLLEEGHEVVCWDTKNGKDIFKMPTYDDRRLFDVIYHLACINQEEALGLPMLNLQVNAYGARLMAAFAKKHGAKFIYTSTASVYGQATQIPTPVSAEIRPRTDYAIAKLTGEWFVRNSGADWIIFRLSNVYGPGQTSENPYCGVIGKFIEAAEAGKPLNIYGTGTQTRDFTYIEDVIDSLTMPDWNSKKILNVSHSSETSVLELAAEVSMATGRKVDLNYTGERAIDGIHSRCLISDADCLTPVDEGLKLTVQWYRNASIRKTSPGRTEENRSQALSR